MSGQLTQYGAEFVANKLSAVAAPFIGASAPGTWIVGQEWINNSGTIISHVYDPSTAAWMTGPYDYYLCLLVSDPTIAGPGGGMVVNMSDLNAIEDTTAGYLRQPVTFSTAAVSSPSSFQTTNLVTFGPYSANQAAAVGWTALVAVPHQVTSGYTPIAGTVNSGLLLYVWQVPNPQQALSTQSISIAAGTMNIGVS